MDASKILYKILLQKKKKEKRKCKPYEWKKMTPKETIFEEEYLEIVYFLKESLTEVFFQNKTIYKNCFA